MWMQQPALMHVGKAAIEQKAFVSTSSLCDVVESVWQCA